jgi:predicted nucleic acid-binding protein
MAGQQIFLAAQTVAELRYGALVAGWGHARRVRLEAAMAATTIVPVTNSLITEVAELRFECRRAGHPLGSRAHTADLWIAASARHINASLLSADRIFDHAPGIRLADV